jgi:hypothetical protein
LQPEARDENPRCLEVQQEKGFPSVSQQDPWGGHNDAPLLPVLGFLRLTSLPHSVLSTQRTMHVNGAAAG